MTARMTLVGIGEALYDIFPDHEALGGAPLNVAVHFHQLTQPQGGRGIVVSRVGDDPLGRQLQEALTARGMATTYIQQDWDRATGRVYVTHEDDGSHSFDIVENAAWDWLQFDPDLEGLARSCDAVCFGSLSQRHPEARSAIQRFLVEARHAIRLFDVNLRQSYFDAGLIRKSCEAATVVKLNHSELPTVLRMLALRPNPEAGDADLAGATLLRERLSLQAVVLTRGKRGTVLINTKGVFEGATPDMPEPDAKADTVGAGDACTAAVIVGLLRRWPGQRVVDFANRVGAYLASQPGATPTLPEEFVREAGA